MKNSLAPTVLLLAGPVLAQVQTPSVVTFMSITPVPTTEEVFTIQTSIPSRSSSSCYEVCIMEPCPPAPCPPVIITDPIRSDGSLGIPSGETPIPSSLVSLDNPITTSVPPKPLPVPISVSLASRNFTVQLPPSFSSLAASRTSTPPPQQSAGASPSLVRDDTPCKIALAISGLTLLGATWAIL